MKQTLVDLLISGLLKKGVAWEARNIDTEIEVPMDQITQEAEGKRIQIKIKVEHIQIKVTE